MICSSKLCSPCLHPYLSQCLTDPSCLGPNCACLPACLFTRFTVSERLSKRYRFLRFCVCMLHVHAYVSPQVSSYGCVHTCVRVCVCEVVHEYVSLRSAQGPLSEKRPGHADNARDPSRSRAELGSHDC